MKEKTILVFTCPECGNHELRIEDIIQTNIEEMWHLGDPGMIDYYEGQTQDPLNSQYVCADCDWHSHLNLERLFIAGTLTEKEITE